MRLLALDTSTAILSVALWDHGSCHSHEVPGQQHAEQALPLVQQLLAEAGLSLRQLDGIAFGAGPGSFTGLRIGCGLAQGLALGADLPVLGVNTLEAIAAGSGQARVITTLDARMGEIYWAAWLATGQGWQALSPTCLTPPEQLTVPTEGSWYGAGNAWTVYADPLQAARAQLLDLVPPATPQANHIAALAAPRLAQGAGRDPVDAHLLYIRDKVALTMDEQRAR